MEEQDLREIGISDPQHRRKLLQAARSLPKVTPMALQPQPWPEPGHLPDTSWTQNRAGLAWLWGMQLTVSCLPLILGAPEGAARGPIHFFSKS